MMKSNKIYLINFSKSVDIEDTNHPIYNDLSNCLEKDESKYIGFTDKDDMFIRLPYYKVQLISDIFSKYSFEFDVVDVTDSVIKGLIQKKYPEVEELTPHLFEDFRYENTSIDDVLDKINEMGINSLDDIDKSILKS